MRTFRPKIKKKDRDSGKSLEWIYRHLSNAQKHSLKNLFDIDTEGDLSIAIQFARKPNKVIWEACQLLRVKLEKNAFRKREKDSVGGSNRKRSLDNGYGRFDSGFGRLNNPT